PHRNHTNRLMNTRHRISIVVADDHPIVAQGVSGLLQAQQDMTVMAVCTSGRAAMKAICDQRPEVAVIDISMPEVDGFTVLSNVARKVPTKIILLTATATDTQIMAAFAHGARGVVLKGGALDRLIECVRDVAAGRYWFPNETVRQDQVFQGDTDQTLTPREREVMALVAQGLSNKVIGRRLHLTEGTVKTHLHRIYGKVGVANRTALAAVAIGERELPGPLSAAVPRSQVRGQSLLLAAVSEDPVAG